MVQISHIALKIKRIQNVILDWLNITMSREHVRTCHYGHLLEIKTQLCKIILEFLLSWNDYSLITFLKSHAECLLTTRFVCRTIQRGVWCMTASVVKTFGEGLCMLFFVSKPHSVLWATESYYCIGIKDRFKKCRGKIRITRNCNILYLCYRGIKTHYNQSWLKTK